MEHNFSFQKKAALLDLVIEKLVILYFVLQVPDYANFVCIIYLLLTIMKRVPQSHRIKIKDPHSE